MRIALASDHAGYPLKQHLVDYLRKQGVHEVLDLGVDDPSVPADYPDVATAIAQALTEGRAERGIAVCGSGVGVCITANKYNGVYAAIAHDSYSAAQGVEHDRMNVLCLGSRVVGTAVGEVLTEAFIAAVPDDHPRFQRRFDKMVAIEEG